MFAIIRFLVGLALFILFAGIVRTWQLENSPEQQAFLKGDTSNMPAGAYKGSVPGYSGSWKGKSFDAANSRGTNMFQNGTLQSEAYPFVTSTGTGIRDKNLTVIRIDYDIAENPWWLRPILDEIVQIGPDHYLGKMQLRVIPQYPFTITFFELQK